MCCKSVLVSCLDKYKASRWPKHNQQRIINYIICITSDNKHGSGSHFNQNRLIWYTPNVKRVNFFFSQLYITKRRFLIVNLELCLYIRVVRRCTRLVYEYNHIPILYPTYICIYNNYYIIFRISIMSIC